MKHCKEVWIIDDEEISNFYTESLLKLNNFTSKVTTFTNAKIALTWLEKMKESEEVPDFIFLDLNMPALDGWDFLETYRKFPKEIKEKCTLYILSSSVDEHDIKRSKIHEEVRDFLSKPLNKLDLEIIKFQTEKTPDPGSSRQASY